MAGRAGRKHISAVAGAASLPITFEKNAVLRAAMVPKLPVVLSLGSRNSINLFFYNDFLSFQIIFL